MRFHLITRFSGGRTAVGEKLRRQENMKVTQRLTFENVKRSLFVSIACICCMPVLMIINAAGGETGTDGILFGLMVFCELLSISFTVLTYMAMRSRDMNMCGMAYKGFWIFFELFSFVLIYANKLAGSGITFYCVMLVAIMLVPVLPLNELLYGVVAEVAYVVVLSACFGTTAYEVFNILALNVVLFIMSRYLYDRTIEHIRLKERVQETGDKAVNDIATGLLNFKGLEKRAYHSVVDSIKNNQVFGVLMIDIDELQKYNLAYGSQAGDKLICEIGEIICATVIKHTDIVARLEGGRFMVCMESNVRGEAENMGEKVRMFVERKRIPQSRQANNSFVTVTVGVAAAIPGSDNDFYELYDMAEAAMYTAKDQGGDMVLFDNHLRGKYRKKAN